MNAIPAVQGSGARSYVIQGQTVTPAGGGARRERRGRRPMSVSAAAARRLIPGTAFEPVEIWPGKALCSLAVIDYRDNDLGDYNEVSIAFFVRRRGGATGIALPRHAARHSCAARCATYIRHLPVDQSFTREAGAHHLGLPEDGRADRLLAATASAPPAP